MIFFKLITAVFFPVVIGYALFFLFFKKWALPLYYKIFLFYGLGLGIIVLEMFFMSISGIKFSFLNIILPWLVICPIIVASYKEAVSFAPSTPFNKPEKFALFIFFLEVIYLFWGSLIIPMIYWDNWAIWGFKAKLFFYNRAIPLTYFFDRFAAYTHPDYPVGLPLMETWLNLCLGYWDDQLVKILFPIFTLGIVSSIYFVLRKFASRIIALSSAIFMLAIPHIIFYGGCGYADIVLAFYNTVAVLAIFLWLDSWDNKLLLLAALFSGFGCWIKNEGIILLLVNTLSFAAVSLLKRRFKAGPLLIYGLTSLLIFLPWIIFHMSLSLTNDVVNLQNLKLALFFGNVNKLGVIFYESFLKLIGFANWGIFWVYFLAASILNIDKIKIKNNLMFIFINMILFLAFVLFIYIISPYDIYWYLGTTFDRILLIMFPLALFFIMRPLGIE